MQQTTPPESARSDRQPPGKVHVALAIVALVGALAAVALSCCKLRRPLPVVPPLPPAPEGILRPTTLRVLLAHARPECEAAGPDGGTWYGPAETGRRTVASGRGPWTVRCAGGRLALDGHDEGESQLEFQPDGGLCRLNGQSYRGGLIVKAHEQDAVNAYNVLDAEDYVRSVVGSEMYSAWPLEALMAQAVAARTFMIYTLGTKGYLTRNDMAYKGEARESRAADLATELTRGIVLTYHDRALPAYFTNTCGGHTAEASKVFALDPIPPLAGVPCEWCRRSPWYEWTAELDPARIVAALRDPRVSAITSIATEGTEPDGYAQVVVVNEHVRLAALGFEYAVGTEVIRSARFGVTESGGRFVFEGRGYGHGVGFCQWGARGLAADGRSWQEVLLYYYPGADLRKAY